MTAPVRMAVVGLGNIGRQHADLLASGAVPGASLAAVCSRTGADAESAPSAASNNPSAASNNPSAASSKEPPHFTSLDALLASGKADAVLVATPTMEHLQMGLAVCQAGLHLLMEKPLAMSLSQARQIANAKRQPGQQVAVMLNQRFHPAYARIKQVLEAGSLGRLQRFGWTMTAWYRPNIYYQVSAWRGTWPGEGGGLLINQCIHNLDILAWLLGLPRRVFAIAGFGKHHQIEVEDEVTATLVYEDGLVGTVTASCGEAPGMNQLDLVGDRGSLRYDGERLRLYTADQSVAEHCAGTQEMFGMPGFNCEELAPLAEVNQHEAVLRNFVGAIAGGGALATPAEAGLASIELANAMLLSAWQGAPLDLPLDADAFEAALQGRIAASSLRQPQDLEVQIEMEKSYR